MMPGKLIAIGMLLIVAMLLIWVLYGEVIVTRIAQARRRAPDNGGRGKDGPWPGR